MKKTRLRKGVLYRMRKRQEWRDRYMLAVTTFAAWRTGYPDRDLVIRDIGKTETKVRAWFGEKAPRVLLIAQKRAVAAFREVMA